MLVCAGLSPHAAIIIPEVAGDEVEQYFQVYPPGEFQIYYQGKLNKTIPF
jgi:hypothetical protein